MSPRIERALISVSDKTGLSEFAAGLHELGIEIFSTGGTAKHLAEANIPVRDVSDYTNFPEMMDGRLKTLHPKIFGGILCRYDRPDDMSGIAEHGIVTFGLIVVNLYPFQATVANPDVTLPEAIEKIDIGGPSLVRAAAKNHAFTTIATSESQYQSILDELKDGQTTSSELRFRLASEAFAHTASYDQAIAAYFAKQPNNDVNDNGDSPFAASTSITLERKATLRYGETHINRQHSTNKLESRTVRI